jgi:ABC-type glycerol-3-phosphate transport system substrate-binding protein
MNKKKFRVLLIALILLISGCSNTRNKDTSAQNISAQNGKGRFMESNISLPKEFDTNVSLQLTKKDGMPYLYSFTGEDQLSVSGFQMNQDGSWTEDTPEWLKKINLPAGVYYQDKVLEDAAGNQYLYYVEISDELYKANLLKSSDGISSETLTPEGWDEEIPDYNSHHTPNDFVMLADGTLVARIGEEIILYNANSMKIDYRIMDKDYDYFFFTTSGQKLIVGKFDQNFKVKTVDVYDTKNGYAKTNYPFESKIDGYAYLDTNDNKDIVLCNRDGIHVLEENTSIWQTVVDGNFTSLAMQTMGINGLIAGSDGNYYVLYSTDNGYSLMKYSYDETINAIPSADLTIYSLIDNATIWKAIALFQKKHPDIKVNYTCAMSKEEYDASDTAIKEDYIKTLNTELLAGGGTDLLLLDGLPADSYVEKGVLTDLSDVLIPLMDNGDLLTNILNPYINEGHIYYAPVRFALPVLYVRNEAVKNVKKLDAIDKLADYANEYEGTTLFGNMTQDDFISIFSPFIASKIMTEDGTINKDNLVALLSDLKVIAENTDIIDEYSEDRYQGNSLLKSDKNSLCLESVNGFKGSMYSFSIATYANADYFIPFENSYIPSCEIGINNNSKQKELCKEFISLVFSEEVGKEVSFDDFPVNAKALTLNSQMDQSIYEHTVDIKNRDGSNRELFCKALNQDQRDTLVNACCSANIRVVSDPQIVSVFLEETTELFKGNSSVEETANRIIEKISLYLSE